MSKNVFEKSNNFTQRSSLNSYNRVELLQKDVAEEFNTYRNFGVFHTVNDVHNEAWNKDDVKKLDEGKMTPGAPGVRSLFNKYSAVLLGNENALEGTDNIQELVDQLVMNASSFRIGNNIPLIDTPDNRKAIIKQSGCTVRELVAASKQGYFSRGPYSYSDFMYCKHLNRVPNNYMITLRRYPIPVNDSLMPVGKYNDRGKTKAGGVDMPAPIGTMVTWMGVSGNDMKNILRYEYSMPFEEKNASWEQINHTGGGQTGILNAIESAIDPACRTAFMSGQQHPMNAALEQYLSKFFNTGGSPYTYQDAHPDKNKVYGPIDRVKSNYRRSEEGLKMSQSFDLVFEYELKAYNGINPRQAMLDLIASIISVTYTTGGFWKGGYKGAGARQSSIFSKMSLFKVASGGGSFTDMVDAFTNDVHTLGDSMIKKSGYDPNKSLAENAKAIINNLLSMLNDIGGMIMGGLLNKLGRPAQYQMNSLLSDAPVGLWHITIGNPHHPIMSMGNMILKSTTIEHSGPLGIDDFPTQLKVTCKFDRGKPRDQYGIEQMYNGGNDRIFHSMGGKIADAYKVAKMYKDNRKTRMEDVKRELERVSEYEIVTPVNVEKGSLLEQMLQKWDLESLKEQKAYLNAWFGDYDTEAQRYPSEEAGLGAFPRESKKETKNDGNKKS